MSGRREFGQNKVGRKFVLCRWHFDRSETGGADARKQILFTTFEALRLQLDCAPGALPNKEPRLLERLDD